MSGRGKGRGGYTWQLKKVALNQSTNLNSLDVGTRYLTLRLVSIAVTTPQVTSHSGTSFSHSDQ